MLQLLAATTNKHKVEEFRGLLSPLKVKVGIITPDSIEGFPPLSENGSTFEENAQSKAIQAAAFADMAAFADDSGLEVDALGGEPGIYSARYAGEGASNEQRIQKLLSNMKGVSNRKARFVCVIAVAYRGELVGSFRGEVEGVIIDSPRGELGFGYDPVFVPDGFVKTFAELDPELKNSISHRAIAMRKTLDFLKADLASMDDMEFA